MKRKIRLGVNIDHIATLRQVRGGTTPYPDILYFMNEAIRGGADQITIHLREDRRHIQDRDLALISKKCKVSVNLEMAVTNEMIGKAIKHKPNIVCLVPEKRQELTTEGGLNIVALKPIITKLVSQMHRHKIKVSTFIEPSIDQVKASFEVGADAIELHTGKWVQLKGSKKKKEWDRLVRASEMAYSLGLKVHAGHGLDYSTTQQITKLPYLEEVNIGHFLVCDGLSEGFRVSVKKMKAILK